MNLFQPRESTSHSNLPHWGGGPGFLPRAGQVLLSMQDKGEQFLHTRSWPNINPGLRLSRPWVVLRLAARSCPTLCDPMDHSPPGPSVHGDSPDKNTAVGCHALCQGIFPSKGSNSGLPHCRWFLSHLNHQVSPSRPWENPNLLSLQHWFQPILGALV